MEISDTNLPVFYASRFFGLAPYLIKRNSKRKIVDYRSNLLLLIYSVCLFATIVILTVRGIIYDTQSYKPLRMKSTLSRVVTSLDIFVVVNACLMGVICGCIGLRNTREMNRRLREADEILYTNELRDRRRSIITLIVTLLGITITLGLDLIAWYRIAKKMKSPENDGLINFQGFLPFYVLYYVLISLQLQFAESALGIGRRYRRLNITLKNAFPEAKSEHTLASVNSGNSSSRFTNNSQNNNYNSANSGVIQIIRVPSLRDVSHTVDVLGHTKNGMKSIKNASSALKSAKKVTPNQQPIHNIKLIENLSYVHASLGKSVGIVSRAFGPVVIAVLGSCLLHLVATSYFLLVEVLGDNDAAFSWLQTLWVIVHITRLLLIVEPCHITSVEAQKTINIVCDILRHNKNPQLRRNLKMFWQQIIAQENKFSACGMCVIDRQILTSYFGALATYLIILMQFQKTDEP